jgi:hypothetical protein
MALVPRGHKEEWLHCEASLSTARRAGFLGSTVFTEGGEHQGAIIQLLPHSGTLHRSTHSLSLCPLETMRVLARVDQSVRSKGQKWAQSNQCRDL